ncbi:MAG TPA: hypothetical protein DCE41_26825 [Cytophagales bacterium]|nr:hypothetical protein [Cytophagales bacterium]HAA18945.1 hypothetical protein [Cytophagales bacterium]HAP65296.1 hypothetical protein [Cytophagales bacterium]
MQPNKGLSSSKFRRYAAIFLLVGTVLIGLQDAFRDGFSGRYDLQQSFGRVALTLLLPVPLIPLLQHLLRSIWFVRPQRYLGLALLSCFSFVVVSFLLSSVSLKLMGFETSWVSAPFLRLYMGREILLLTLICALAAIDAKFPKAEDD